MDADDFGAPEPMPIGRISPLLSSASLYLALIKGETDEVAQVSKTAVSGINSRQPQRQAFPGPSSAGFTGSRSSSANTGSLQLLQYQTGNGTPK